MEGQENKNIARWPDFEKVKKEAEEFYSQAGEVLNPYLERKVVFNAKGREHLKFKSHGKARSSGDQYERLKLLKYAPEVIRLSRTVQGFSRVKKFEINRSNHRNEKILTDVVYYEFVAVLRERLRVRVVVKEIGSAPPFFWSIIPFLRS